MTRRKVSSVLAPLGAATLLALLAGATIIVISLVRGSIRPSGNGIGASATAAVGGAGAASAPGTPASTSGLKPRPTPQATVRAPEPPPSATGAGGDSGQALMRKLRGLAGRDPEQILRLAREANARDPDGPDAAERGWMVVKSLTDLQRFSEAKDEAQTMVNRYPGTSWAQDVQRHLLSNPL